ncbi:hypothetical protein ACO1ZW_22455 [Enterobacter kobei]|uniref:hypothetical protein n=1 Tax=Gammaproteobacteria TaxID=1236 RepID=UPI002147CE7A|nr:MULTISPECIES: hypothetical protein [Gammaproteobacteria]MCR1299765.1 hypothetical protein [Enterobacter kobei]MEA9418293.1 hypothetical protein [Aeromonas caviae]
MKGLTGHANTVSIPKKAATPIAVFSHLEKVRILIYVNTDSGQYEHPAFPALGSVLF